MSGPLGLKSTFPQRYCNPFSVINQRNLGVGKICFSFSREQLDSTETAKTLQTLQDSVKVTVTLTSV